MTGTQRTRYSKKGFTLIELLVVIAIIALLLSVLLPALRKAKDQVKLVVCASNQHQIIAAVGVYQGDHNGKLPPAIAGRTDWTGLGGMKYHWHRPTAMSYRPFDPVTMNGGYHGKYLFPYLEDVEVFNCPFSPIEGSKIIGTDTNGEPLTYQRNYEEGIRGADASYMFLWNYQGFDNAVSPTRVVGAGSNKKDAANLLTADVMFYTRNMTSPHVTTWALTHPFKDSSKNLNSYVHHELYDPSRSRMPEDVRFNAGYLDGSVERYLSRDTIVTRNAIVDMYLPQKLK